MAEAGQKLEKLVQFTSHRLAYLGLYLTSVDERLCYHGLGGSTNQLYKPQH